MQLRGFYFSSSNSQTVGAYFYDGTKLDGLEFLVQNAGILARVQQNANVNTNTNTHSGCSCVTMAPTCID